MAGARTRTGVVLLLLATWLSAPAVEQEPEPPEAVSREVVVVEEPPAPAEDTTEPAEGTRAVTELVREAHSVSAVATASTIVQAVAALAVALFTGLLVYFNHGLLQATKASADAASRNAEIARRTAEIAEQTLRVTQKPAIFAGDWALKGMEPGKALPAPRVRFTLVNSGQTTATLLRARSKGFFDVERPAINPFESSAVKEINVAGVAIPRTKTHDQEVELLGISAEQCADVRAGTLKFWFAFELTYRDAFEPPREHTVRWFKVYIPGKTGLATDMASGYNLGD